MMWSEFGAVFCLSSGKKKKGFSRERGGTRLRFLTNKVAMSSINLHVNLPAKWLNMLKKKRWLYC